MKKKTTKKVKKTITIKEITTIILGLSIVLVRVLMPTHNTISKTLIILECTLEMLIAISIVLINLNEIKNMFKKKYASTDQFFTKVIIVFALVTFGNGIIQLAIGGLSKLLFNYDLANACDPAAQVAEEFVKVFPFGLMISTCIAAPIAEELAFRYTFKKIINNKISYVIISSLLFGFIHTASFLTLGILNYAVFGALFCIAYLKIDDIRVLIAAHMFNNILAMLGSIL